MDEPNEDQDPEPVPPTAERVARRALALSALSCRGLIESGGKEEWARNLHAQVLAWVDDVNLESELESKEAVLLEAPLGSLDRRSEVDASWRSEGLAVLAWSLGAIDFPPYDELVDPKEIAESLGFLETPSEHLRRSWSLRPEEEIEEIADVMLGLHWRLREFSLGKRSMDFQNVKLWFGDFDTSRLRFLEKDLDVRGRPIAKATREDFRECLSIARERHQAANWLLGFDPVYSEVATDT